MAYAIIMPGAFVTNAHVQLSLHFVLQATNFTAVFFDIFMSNINLLSIESVSKCQ